MVQVLRSLAFQLFFYLWTAALCLAVLPVFPFLSPAAMRATARVWERMTLRVLSVVVGLSYEVRGSERLPQTPVLLAAKHQSAWETLAFHVIVPDLAVGLKEELTRIPVFGWYLMRAENIRIDRGAAARAIRSLITGAKIAVGRGLSVLIFPEGTRMAPGEAPDYKPGVAALYAALDLPVVPVALNSGVFWRRREFVKRPGLIVVEFLEPIPPGLARKAFMQHLEQAIETATASLVAEAHGRGAGQSVGRSV
ncbi:MAG: lysophospholipid acyltransferase family protein [Geminicoccaceae bacterium]